MPAAGSTPQIVTVTGVEDHWDDGDVAYSIVTGTAASGDALYNGLNPPDVSVTNVDDDTAAVLLNPTSGLTTTEAGGVATFTVVLGSQPTAQVTVPLSSSDTSEGTVSASTLTFLPEDWSVPQTVTITGVDDHVDDGNIAYSVVTAPVVSTDALYGGLNPLDVAVINSDNDTAGITVAPVTGLGTNEAGGTATFTVVLDSEPTAAVAISVSSSDTSEGTLSLASLTFDAEDWDTPQTVTVTGVDDNVDDGDVGYSMVLAPAVSTDPLYSGRNPADVTLANADD